MTAPQEPTQAAYMDVMPLAPDAPAETTPDAAFDSSIAAKYDAVMAFCLTRGQVLFTTLMTEFVDIHLGDLERYAVLAPDSNCFKSSCIWDKSACTRSLAAALRMTCAAHVLSILSTSNQMWVCAKCLDVVMPVQSHA